MDQLVAFLVPAEGAQIETRVLRARLRESLPAYMVPARFEMSMNCRVCRLEKLDRKSLKARELTLVVNTEAQEEPQNETEAALLAAAQKVLPPQSIPFDADFFTDLGGHSLIAAKFVSEIRQTPALAERHTAGHVCERARCASSGQILDDRAASHGRWQGQQAGRPDVCACTDLEAVPVRHRAGHRARPLFSLVTIQWLGLFLASIWILRSDAPLWLEMVTLLGVYAGINIGVKLIIIALKWVIIGRTKPGVYPLWGVYYFRLWLVQRLVQVTTMKFLQSSPLMRWYLRALGAKVGKDAMIGEIEVGAIDF
jgi:hypothetical protein